MENFVDFGGNGDDEGLALGFVASKSESSPTNLSFSLDLGKILSRNTFIF